MLLLALIAAVSRRWPAGWQHAFAVAFEMSREYLWALITLIVAIALAFILLSTAKDETKSEDISAAAGVSLRSQTQPALLERRRSCIPQPRYLLAVSEPS